MKILLIVENRQTPRNILNPCLFIHYELQGEHNMAWENAYILTVADSAVILTLVLFTLYFIYHLKFYASILWASLFTISSYSLLFINNLAFGTGVIKRLPASWMLAKAFSHGFDATAFLLIVWAA